MGIGIKLDTANFKDKNFGTGNVIKYGYLDYIQGDRNSYIDTGFSGFRNSYADVAGTFPTDAPKVEVDVTLVRVTNRQDSIIFAPKTNSIPISQFVASNAINISGKGATGKFTEYVDGQRCKIVYGSVKTYINDVMVADNTNMSNQYRLNNQNDSICLLGGMINLDGTQTFSYGVQKIHGFKAYKGETLVLDLRPYRKYDGIVCMKDEVSGEYFYNQGAGSFIGV